MGTGSEARSGNDNPNTIVEPKLAPGQLRHGPPDMIGMPAERDLGQVPKFPLISPERADMSTTARPAAPTVMGRVQDLETEVMQQNSHILVLHRIVDQLVDEVNGLRNQLGMEQWKPQVRVEDNP